MKNKAWQAISYIDIADAKSDTHSIPGDVFICEPLGDSTVVSVDVVNTRLQIVTHPGVVVKPKDKVWLRLDPVHMLLFDAQTEKAIVN